MLPLFVLIFLEIDMVKSMTGYGKSEVNIGEKKITVEVRSLNSKQLDLSVRMPSMYRSAEYDIRNMVAKAAQRGKVEVYISVESNVAKSSNVVNGELFGFYLEQLKGVAAQSGLNMDSPEANATLVATIMRMPEIISVQADLMSDQDKIAIFECVTAALGNFNEFRMREGATLMVDLLERIATIEALKLEIEPYETSRVDIIRERIKDHIERSSVAIDNNRLEQEMIYYVEKLDVTEEKVRLTTHCNYFKEVSAGEDAVGRKLGFICQEIGREINTLGSKANDATIQRIVVQMKDELERIKEQVLNIL